MANLAVTESSLPNVLAELEEAFFNIPFENSDYQNKTFVLAAQQTPGRMYRAIGLRMFAKLRAVQECLLNREKAKIDIEEMEYKISLPETNEFDRRRLRVEIMRIRNNENWENKLLHDALHELDCLYAEFKALPSYTREEFEAEEAKHFRLKLERSASASGPMEALLNMEVDAPKLLKG